LTEAERNVSLLLQDTEALHDKHLSLEDEIIDFRSKLSSALNERDDADTTLYERIQELHGKIQELEAAQSYFAVLAKAEQLSLVPFAWYLTI
jgi:predicted  nucleic acid-binding Zn-ribbon protein